MQIDRKFVLARAGNILYCIDQHAADERVNLERMEVGWSLPLASRLTCVTNATVMRSLRRSARTDLRVTSEAVC